MAEYTYVTKKYKIQQRTSDTEITTLHPETEASITLIQPIAGLDAINTQKALEKLNEKIDIVQSSILYDTKAHWDSQPSLRTKANTIYVYTDAFTYTVDGQQVVVAGIKVGDGNAYLIDVAFITDYLANAIVELNQTVQNHLDDNVRHITSAERTKWNNKINYELSEEDQELLIINRN